MLNRSIINHSSATHQGRDGRCALALREHQYAGDVTLYNTQELWRDGFPQSEAILAEIQGQPGTEGG